MMKNKISLLLATLMMLAAGGTESFANDAEPVKTENTQTWNLIISPYVWAASLNGNAALAGRYSHVDIPFSDVIHHLDYALMGNVELTNSQWGVYGDFQHVQTSQKEKVYQQTLGLRVTTTNIAFGAYYRIFEQPLGGDTVFGRPRRIAIEPTAGVRWTKLNVHAKAIGLQTVKRADWFDPFVGLRISADLTDRWNLFVSGNVGGFGAGSDISYDVQAYLGYRTFIFGQPTILRMGYRWLYQDYESDDFTGNKFRWKINQHGPAIGFSMRF
ncbi:hypothetical protein WJT86_08875 [Microvirga sp. W0021]|uniref:Outer membrane protein beta-barrel domain-containing protein n=1 Tax=Hohaiivirga grylli TaxID=3133970 RepID=A0ABV0BJJ1_9HYPH